MAGGRAHRVVDGDDGQRPEHVALRRMALHLADLLFQRAAGQRDAEHRFLKLAGLAVLQSLAARILALAVAENAVVDLVQRLLGVHAVVGQGKAFAPAPIMLRQAQHGDAVAFDGLDRHQVLGIDAARHMKQRAAVVDCLAVRGQRGPCGVAQRDVQRRGIAGGVPGGDVAGESSFGQGRLHARGQCGRQYGTVEAGRIGIFLDGLTLHEQPFAGVDRVQRVGGAGQRQGLLLDAEQRRDEAVQIRSGGHDQVRLIAGRQVFRFGAGSQQPLLQGRVLFTQGLQEQPVEPDQPVAAGKIGQGKTETQQGGNRGRHGADHLPSKVSDRAGVSAEPRRRRTHGPEAVVGFSAAADATPYPTRQPWPARARFAGASDVAITRPAKVIDPAGAIRLIRVTYPVLRGFSRLKSNQRTQQVSAIVKVCPTMKLTS